MEISMLSYLVQSSPSGSSCIPAHLPAIIDIVEYTVTGRVSYNSNIFTIIIFSHLFNHFYDFIPHQSFPYFSDIRCINFHYQEHLAFRPMECHCHKNYILSHCFFLLHYQIQTFVCHSSCRILYPAFVWLYQPLSRSNDLTLSDLLHNH